MKKNQLIWFWLFFFIGFGFLFNQEEEPIKKSISVVNVEVMVRVLANNKPVGNLKKEDFAIYEDGKPQVINGFTQNSKKIAPAIETKIDQTPPSRYFVLVFKVYDYNQHLLDGLAYTFDKLLTPQDQLLVFINNNSKEYNDLHEMANIRAEIEQDLKTQCHETLNQMRANLRELELFVDGKKASIVNASDSSKSSLPALVDDFLKRYLQILTDYKKRFMTQNIDNYYFFAQHLQKVKNEKWVISFYQIEMLPQLVPHRELMNAVDTVLNQTQIDNNAYASVLMRLLQEIDKESKTGYAFPAQEVGKLFSKSNATFHSILMNAQIESNSENLKFIQIGSSIETSFRELTKNTGGTLITSSDLATSLATISEIEDIYYMLSYAPENANKRGTITVKVSNKNYDVLYNKNQFEDYFKNYVNKKEIENPTVKITGLSMVDKKLSLVIENFLLGKLKDETTGVLKLRIRVQNDLDQSVYDQSKVVKAAGKNFSLSIGFAFLDIGQYNVIVDVTDQVSGKSCTETIQTDIY
jgi:VWFA-related protein